jgi:hypothetical protein
LNLVVAKHNKYNDRFILRNQSSIKFAPARTAFDQQSKYVNMQYQIPDGMHIIPPDHLDTRSDLMVDEDLANPKPIIEGNEKNIWFF